MDGFICTKALILFGQGYMPGDFIPKEKVLPSRVRTLIREKYITFATNTVGKRSAPVRQKKQVGKADTAQKDKVSDGEDE